MGTAIVWRKSIYDSGKCPSCGAQMMNGSGDPMGVTSVNGYVYCDKCNLLVAVLKPYHGDAKPGDKCGKWEGDAL